MSNDAINWCRPFPIKGWAKAILFCLAEHHNEITGRCDPSLATVAHEVGCSDQTVRRGMRELIALGVMKATKRRGRPDLLVLDFTRTADTEAGPPLSESQDPPDTQIPTPLTEGHHPPIRVIPEPEVTRIEPEVTHESHQPSEPPDSASFDFGSVVSQGNGGLGNPGNRAIDAWNARAIERGWPQIQSRSPPRLRAVQARLGEIGGLDGWALMLGKLEATPWLSKQGFLSFDWITKPTNLAKLMEGNYDRHTSRAEAEPTGISSILAAFGRPGPGG